MRPAASAGRTKTGKNRKMDDRRHWAGPMPDNGCGSGITGPAAFYDLLHEWLEAEIAKNPSRNELSIRIAARAVKIVFARPETRSYFSAAFEHVEQDGGGDPALTVFCSEAGGEFMERALSLLPGRYSSVNERDVPFLVRDGITIAPGREGGTLSVLNIPEGKAAFLFADLAKLPYHEQGSPFRNIFQWWFDGKEGTMLHSGAVSLSGKALLLSGKGGSGKSTIALACLLDGMDYLGDDYVVVRGKKDIAVSSLYRSLKLAGDALARFPALRESPANPGFSQAEKAVIFLRESSAGKVVCGSSLQGIVIPEISGTADSSFSRISAAEGFRALAPSTIFQHVGKRNDIAAFTGNLARALPCFKLHAGRDAAGIAGTVRAILRES